MNILITGASSGIGAATAKILAKEGHRVILLARRKEKLDEVAKECGKEVQTHAVDVSSLDSIDRFFASWSPPAGEELVLVNNAGVGHFGPFHEMSRDDWSAQINTNLVGLMAMTHGVLGYMLSQGKGRIINVLSVAAEIHFESGAAYCASKAGALAFAHSLATQVRKSGIAVTNILPGATDTPIWDDKTWKPEQADMIPAQAIAETIAYVVNAPRDRALDHITVNPPKGIL